ncbi:MAG: hypothetical protein WCR31_06415 [Treponema sp.]
MTTNQWITEDILASGLKTEISGLVAASENGFVTGEIIDRIKEMYSVSDDGIYTYVQNLQDELTAVLVDFKRDVNSIVSMADDEADIKVQNPEDETWAAFEVKENEILAAGYC